jgi:hypothetical protein
MGILVLCKRSDGRNYKSNIISYMKIFGGTLEHIREPYKKHFSPIHTFVIPQYITNTKKKYIKYGINISPKELVKFKVII